MSSVENKRLDEVHPRLKIKPRRWIPLCKGEGGVMGTIRAALARVVIDTRKLFRLKGCQLVGKGCMKMIEILSSCLLSQ